MGGKNHSNTRYAFLEGLRGWAAVYVLYYHVFLATNFDHSLPVVSRVLASPLGEGAFAMGAFTAEVAAGSLQDLRKTLWIRTIAIGGAMALLTWMALWQAGYDIQMAQAIRIVSAPTACAWILWMLDPRSEVSWLRRMLESKPLQTLGSFSYSTYLIHQPILVLVDIFLRHQGVQGTPLLLIQFAVTAPFAIACSYGFYRLVERPVMQLRRRRGTAATAPASPSDASPGSYAHLASARR